MNKRGKKVRTMLNYLGTAKTFESQT